MERGIWWAAVYGVAQSRTRPKRLSSSSSRRRPGEDRALACKPRKKLRSPASLSCHCCVYSPPGLLPPALGAQLVKNLPASRETRV